MKASFFPGCSLHSSAVEYGISAEAACSALDIELQEINGWVCCGATSAHSLDKKLSLALPAISLARAEKDGAAEIVVACAACYNRFLSTRLALVDRETQKGIRELLDIPFENRVEVKHLLPYLLKNVGKENLASRIKRPLEGLRVACYYGCLLVRPHRMMQFDDPERPQILDDLMRILGADPVMWYHKTECCGASLSLTHPEMVLNLSGKILRRAKDAGAQCVVTVCPLCQGNLDLRQQEIEKKKMVALNLPVFYFTELLSVALGMEGRTIGLAKHMVDPLPVLSGKRAILQVGTGS